MTRRSATPNAGRVAALCAAGLLAHAGLLAGTARAVGLGPVAKTVAGVSGVAANLAVARGLRDHGGRPGPADVVTLTRTLISCTVAGLVTEAVARPAAARAIAPLSTVALILDGVDGVVARRTESVSGFGATFDGEADAFLILVLSAHAARSYGPWVLAGGLARYAFGAAGVPWPWLRRRLPFRYWRKVATATEGIALTAASVRSLPRPATTAGLAVGLALIAESFGRDVVWLWRRRRPPDEGCIG